MNNDLNFKEIPIVNMFNITGTKTTSLTDLKKSKKYDQKYPYITTKSNNEGIEGFFKDYTEEGKVLVVDSATDGNVHYQKNNFSASDHVEKLIPKFHITDNIGLYLTYAIKSSTDGLFKYGYKLSQKRMSNLKVILPTNEKNEPDYEYMDNYIEEIKDKKILKYKKYCENKLKNIEYKEIEQLNNKEWKEFFINEILNIYSSKAKIDKNKLNNISGKYPYITRTDRNNGIELLIAFQSELKPNEKEKLIVGGDTQTVFYQNYEFYTGDKIIIAENKQFNEYSYLFLSNIMKEALSKFKYGGNAVTQKRLKRTKIMLPVDSNKKIDYEYMEQYIKNIMYLKYHKYLDYLEKKYNI